MRDKITLVLQTREAGRTRRCHTMTVAKEQDLAQHSFNMAMLLDVLYPRSVLDLGSYYKLLRWCLWHDLHERYTGDVPAGLRYFHPSTRAGFKEVGRFVNEKLRFPVPKLNDEEKKWATALDQLEFVLHCEDEVAMGNRHMQPYLDDMRCWFNENRKNIPPEVWDFFENFKWHRTSQRL